MYTVVIQEQPARCRDKDGGQPRASPTQSHVIQLHDTTQLVTTKF